MKCPSCQQDNNPSFTHCWKCGYSLTGDKTVVTPPPGSKRIALWNQGLLVLMLGFFLNAFLRASGVGGVSVEISRIAIIVGTIMMIVGLFQKKRKKQA